MPAAPPKNSPLYFLPVLWGEIQLSSRPQITTVAVIALTFERDCSSHVHIATQPNTHRTTVRHLPALSSRGSRSLLIVHYLLCLCPEN